MRLQHGLPAGHLARDTVYLGGDIEIALSAQEIAGLRPADAAHEAKGGVQLRLGAARREVEVLAATLGVEAGGHRDGFDQGGLTASVLADEAGYFWMQIERLERANGRDGEWIALEAFHLFPDQGDGPEEGVEPALPRVGQAVRSAFNRPSRIPRRHPVRWP